MSWDNFLEFLRKTLVKIILPIKNKREKWLSNFRFSILFRISLGYIRLLVVYGIVLMAGIFTIYMLAEKEDYNDMAQDIIASIGEAE